jgi:hypothetical protein
MSASLRASMTMTAGSFSHHRGSLQRGAGSLQRGGGPGAGSFRD